MTLRRTSVAAAEPAEARRAPPRGDSARTKRDARAARPRVARRTQEERREGTIRLLLDAACDELAEAGYASATTARIAARAKVSQGALFRHFPTREALMVAAAEDIGRQMLESYEAAFLSRPSRGAGAERASLEGALRLLREHCRTEKNQAFYELLVAGRTDRALREALRGPAVAYYAAIERLAASLLPELARALGASFSLLVHTVLATFDGEALHAFVLPEQDALREGRIELVAALVAAAASSRAPR